MKFLRNILDSQEKHFEKGGKLEKLYPLFEATDTIFFTPKSVTKGNTHVRDALDLKRMMIVVVVAMLPVMIMALYNTGLQANLAITAGATPLINWQEALYTGMGMSYAPGLVSNLMHGAVYFVPILLVTFIVGGNAEVLFSVMRKHEINEGFLVTGFIFPLTLPAAIPLWQVAAGIIFGVVIGKEIFGGTGMNILNPALTARAFLFFAYPGQISGDKVWTAATMADGTSGATLLGQQAASDVLSTQALGGEMWMDSFLGFTSGAMGETSALACLIGAGILIITRIGSWRTMVGITAGTAVMGLLFNAIGSETNSMFALPFYWHMVIGGWAFGAVFMATDPVSSAFTNKGKLIYGVGIGVMVMLVRVVNPAYPEGMMLAILFMNMFAPLIDHIFISGNIKRRLARNAGKVAA